MSIRDVLSTSQKTLDKKNASNKVANDDEFNKIMEEELQANDDRHINEFVEQTLAKAPESEKQIWLRMKEELGI